MTYDLNSPEGRFACIEALGPDGYNAAMLEHQRRNTLAVVNGYPIRRVMSRFGPIFMIDGAGFGCASLAEAKLKAAALPGKEARP